MSWTQQLDRNQQQVIPLSVRVGSMLALHKIAGVESSKDDTNSHHLASFIRDSGLLPMKQSSDRLNGMPYHCGIAYNT